MKQLIRLLSRVADSNSLQYEPLRSRSGRRPRTVPEGHVPVFVGEEMERFAVRAELLGHPVFLELLRRSAQEYGYEQPGVLRIPCPVPLFERVLDYLLESGNRQELSDEMIEAELLQFFEDGQLDGDQIDLSCSCT